jgi:hypothetical protein
MTETAENQTVNQEVENPSIAAKKKDSPAKEPKKKEVELSREQQLAQPLLRMVPQGGSKKVRIIRRNTTRMPSDVFKDSITKIGSEWKENTRSMIRGLSVEEEKAYLPRILQVQPDSPNWDRALEQYWADFSLRVPSEGLELEIYVDKNNNPTESNLKDFISFRFAKVSSRVAVTPEEIENKAMFPYYVEDKKAQNLSAYEKLQISKRASLNFMKLVKSDDNNAFTNPDKVDWVLELYKRTDSSLPTIASMDSTDKEVYLSNKSAEDAETFNAIVEDPQLESKSFIVKCISLGVLTRIGNAILNGQEKIGDSLEEAVYYLQDAKNSKVDITLKQRVKELEPVKMS